MFVVKNRKIFYSLSALLVLGSIFLMVTKGFNFGIDF
ncbi:protein translocase subunit SecF, partial [Candidatus Parcubacteria bacterium]|nr:protein translocase subunit SecF [Candidatus Parcubacteria bacterium]